MRLSVTLLASATTTTAPATARRPLAALLPPLPLYRRLLRAHRRHLPPDMRVLGDRYVAAEFRAHRGVDNPAHLIGFLTEWQLYAQKIEGEGWVGERLEEGKLEKMNDQQIGQLYELMRAIQNRSKDGGGEGSSGSS